MPAPRTLSVISLKAARTGYILNEERGFFSVVIPEATTNLITNPSAETNTTGYTAGAGSLARSTAEQYHGAYSVAYTPSAALTDGCYYGTVSLTSGTTYTFSLKLKGVAGVPYQLYFATTGGVLLGGAFTFRATGFWQWVNVRYTETASTTRRLYIAKNGHASVAPFSIDGLQLEAKAYPTTYCDGDQQGLIPSQFPPAYLWSGTPHASTSSRSAQTRAGGKVVNLDVYGYRVIAYTGLGLTTLANVVLPFSQADGAYYETTTKPPRAFALTGRWDEATFAQFQRHRSDMYAALSPDLTSPRQPLVLLYQAFDRLTPIGDPLRIVATYDTGAEGDTIGLFSEAATLHFTQYQTSALTANDGGALLSAPSSVTNANAIIQRSGTGVWRALGTGANSTVNALLTGPDGTLYAGGAFTAMDGVANTSRIAKWDGSAWTAMGTGANGIVYGLAAGPDGSIYAVGAFTLMGGVANTSRIAKWNGSAWSALSTGLNNDTFAVIVGPDGSLYAAGGFTTAGGGAAVAIAKWDGAAWSALSTGLSSTGFALVFGRDNYLYVGGAFVTAGGVTVNGVARWTGSAFVALSTGVAGSAASVYALAVGFDNTLYAGGAFTSAGGVAAAYAAKWNGSAWTPLGSGLSSDVNAFALAPNSVLYAGGTFTTAGGITLPDRQALWTGNAWAPIAIDLPATSNNTALNVTPGNVLTIGFVSSGTATAPTVTTITNGGSAATFPVFTIKGPTTGTARVYAIENSTTSKAIYLNYTINAGETAVLRLDPANISFTSDFQGNILSTIMPGSNRTDFALNPGANILSYLASDTSVVVIAQWPTIFNAVDEALS